MDGKRTKRRDVTAFSNAAPRYLAQYAPGVTPVQRRKARLNALGSENPVRKATSAADVPRTAKCRTASSRRTSSRICW